MKRRHTAKDKRNETYTIEAKNGSSVIMVSLLPNRDIMVQDYSHQNSRYELIRRLNAMGIKTETALDSLCG